MKHLLLAILLSVIYLVLGNLAGIVRTDYPDQGVVKVLFAPYCFIAGISSFAGWDRLALVLEAIVWLFSIPVFLFLVKAGAAISGRSQQQSAATHSGQID